MGPTGLGGAGHGGVVRLGQEEGGHHAVGPGGVVWLGDRGTEQTHTTQRAVHQAQLQVRSRYDLRVIILVPLVASVSFKRVKWSVGRYVSGSRYECFG